MKKIAFLLLALILNCTFLHSQTVYTLDNTVLTANLATNTSASNIYIRSANYPSAYNINTFGSITVNATSSCSQIKFQVEAFDTELNYDKLDIYLGTSTTPYLRNWRPTVGTVYTFPASQIRVTFSSDFSEALTGFSFLVSSVAVTAPGSFGNALRFDGYTGIVVCPNDVVPTSGEYTISLWAKNNYSFNTTDVGTIFAQSQYLSLHFGQSGEISIGNSWGTIAASYPNDAAWHHYSIVRTSTNAFFYIDGNLAATKGSAIPSLDINNNLYLSPENVGFSGAVDEFCVFNYAKTQDQIRSTMNIQLGGTETGLRAYYDFNQGTADGTNTTQLTLFDKSYNHFDGTLGYMALISPSLSNYVVGNTYTIAPITGNTKICAGSSTQLSNATFGGLWSGDASTQTGLYTFNSAGTFGVRYRILSNESTGGCASIFADVFYVNVRPSPPPIITPSNGNLCAGSNTTLTATSVGDFGRSLRFNPNNVQQYAAIGNNPLLNSQSFTISLWVKPSTGSQPNGGAVLNDLSSANYGYSLTSDGNNNYTWTTNEITGPFLPFLTISSIQFKLSAGIWQHIAMVYNKNSTRYIYVDGFLVGSSSTEYYGINYNSVGGSDPIYLGMKTGTNVNWYGAIDELRMYNTNLSQTQISNEMNTAPSTTNLVGYYKMEDNFLAEAMISPAYNGNLSSGSAITYEDHTNYLWSTGNNSKSITVSTAGPYNVSLGYGRSCPATSAVTEVAALNVGSIKVKQLFPTANDPYSGHAIKYPSEYTVGSPEQDAILINVPPSISNNSDIIKLWQEVSYANGAWGTNWTNVANPTFTDGGATLLTPIVDVDKKYRLNVNFIGCGVTKPTNEVTIRVNSLTNVPHSTGNSTRVGRISGYVLTLGGSGIYGVTVSLKRVTNLSGGPNNYAISTTTDATGRYIFDNVFYGDYTLGDPQTVSYQLTATLIGHVIVPKNPELNQNYRKVDFTVGNYISPAIANGEMQDINNFIDNTGFDITGFVSQTCSACLTGFNKDSINNIVIKTTTITINAIAPFDQLTGTPGNPFTTNYGKFNINVTNPGTYVLTPRYKSHTFTPTTSDVVISNTNSTPRYFSDTKTYTISGKFAASNEVTGNLVASEYIGKAIIEFTDTVEGRPGYKLKAYAYSGTNGTYSITLPARKWRAKLIGYNSLTTVSGTQNSIDIDSTKLKAFFNDKGLKDLVIDLDSVSGTGKTLDLFYHRPPKIYVVGLDIPNCPAVTSGLNQAPAFIKLEQGVKKEYQVRIFEGDSTHGFPIPSSFVNTCAGVNLPITALVTSQQLGTVKISAPGVRNCTFSINGTNYFADSIFNSIIAGNYVAYVKNADGCIFSKPLVVPGSSNPCSSVSSIAIEDTVINPTIGKNDGQVILKSPRSSGTNVYTYTILGAGQSGVTYISSLDTIKTIGLGSYTMIVRNGNNGTGCIVGTKQINVISTNSTPIKMYTNITNIGLDLTLNQIPTALEITSRTSRNFNYINGVLNTSIVPGSPKIIAPYQKNISFEYTDQYGRSAVIGSNNNETPQIITKYAVVTGAQFSRAFFTTATPEVPIMVLHAPPGDQSKSSWAVEKTSETSMSFSAAKSRSLQNYSQLKLGVKYDVGMLISSEFAAWANVDVNVMNTESYINGRECVITNTNKQSVETNPGGTDVFIGAAINFTYTDADILNANGCVMSLTREMIIAPQGFGTRYRYSEDFIKNTLIPGFDDQISSSSTTPVEKERASRSKDSWEQMIINNNLNKANAGVYNPSIPNISFDGGVGAITDETTISKTGTNTIDVEVDIESSVGIGVGLEIGGSGFTNNTTIGMRITTGSSNSISSSLSTTMGYTLDDDDDGDAFTVDIKKDPVYGTPVFDLLAGRASCPSDDISQRRDQAQLEVVTNLNGVPYPQIRNDIPFNPNSGPIYYLKVNNLSESRQTRSYKLKLDPSSTTATVKINGANYSSADYLDILNLAYGASSQPIQVEVIKNAASTIFNYPDIKFMVYDACSTAGGAELSSNTITANFVTACSGINLVTPLPNVTSVNNILPITFNGLTAGGFIQITLEYQLEGANSWTTGNSFSASEIGNSTSFTYNWPITINMLDGNYNVRLKLVCNNGASTAVVYSNLSTVKMDRIAPTLFGRPVPSDGSYSRGDEISFSYNENIVLSNLSSNISVSKKSGSTTSPVTCQLSGYQNKIIIYPTSTLSAGDTVRVVSQGITDLFGNISAKKDTLVFVVGAPQVGTARTINLSNTGLTTVSEVNTDTLRVNFTLSNLGAGVTNNTIATVVNFAITGSATFASDYTVVLPLNNPYSIVNTLTGAITTLAVNNFLNSYNGSTGSVVIPAGQNAVQLRLVPKSDLSVESSETISISILSGADYQLGTALSVTNTITDNNISVVPSITVSGTTCSRVLTTSTTNGGLAVTSYQWQKDGVDIVGATASSYSPTTSGSYTVKITVGVKVGASAAYVYNKATTSSTTNTSICGSALPYSWNGQSYTTAGTYSVTIPNAAGCDSVATLVLTVQSGTSLAAITTLTQTLVSNVCGARVYRYTATPVVGATSYIWTLPTSVGGVSGVTVDTTVSDGSTIKLKFVSNLAALTTDSIKVIANSGCGSSPIKSIKLTNTLISAPAAPLVTVTPISVNTCGARRYRYSASALPAATATAVAALGWSWSNPEGTVGSTGTIDSGTATSQIITVTYTSNAAAAAGDTIRVRFNSACGLGTSKATKLTNTALPVPAAPTVTVAAVTTNLCGPRVYRYSASALPVGATGWSWSLPEGPNGATGSLDSGSLSSQVIKITYTSNAAAVAGDTIRVAFTSVCGLGASKATKLTNTLFNPPASTTSTTNTSVCSSALPYVWNGQSYTTGGTYSVTLPNAAGCDSVATLVLTVQTSTSLAAITTLTQTLVSNVCGARVYRFTATPVVGATSYIWTLPTSVGGVSGVTVDTTVTNGSTIKLKFVSNLAALTTDSIKVVATSGCVSSAIKSIKLTNTLISAPAVPATITITLIQTICSNKIYRYAAPALPAATTTAVAATGYVWEFLGTLGANASIDSGSLTSQTIRVSYTNNAASAVGDSIKLSYASSCGNSIAKAAKLTNTLLSAPAAPTVTVTPISVNTCGARIYRYTASALPIATATAGAATGWSWSLPEGPTGSTGTLDSGILGGQVIRIKYTSNVAAVAGDTIRVAFTSACGLGTSKATKLTNTALPVPAAPTVTVAAITTNVCGPRVYRYSASALTVGATGWSWSLPEGPVGSSGSLDSGSLTSQVIKIKYTSNEAAVAGDTIRIAFNSLCGLGASKATKLTNTLFNPPVATTSTTNTSVCSSALPYVWNGQSYTTSGTYSVTIPNAIGCDSIPTLVLTVQTSTALAAITTLTQTLVTNECGARVYRYVATPVVGATSYIWTLPTSVGGVSGVTVDTTVSNGSTIKLKFASNLAALTTDSIKVVATSGCVNSARKSIKLTNTLISAPAAPLVTVAAVITNECGARIYRYSASALPVATATTSAGTSWSWSLPEGPNGSTGTLDSGILTGQVIKIRYTSNAAAVAGDTIRVAFNSACGLGAKKATKLTNAVLNPPAAPTVTVAAITTNVCGARVYRYTASALPIATATAGAATGWSWSLPTGPTGATGTLDSGVLGGQVIKIRYTSNAAAVTGDTIRVRFTSGCGLGTSKATKLTNTVLNAPLAPATVTIALASNVCGVRVYRYTAPVLPIATTTAGAATGYAWSLPVGPVGSTGVLDSGVLAGAGARFIKIRYSSNLAASAGDTIKVAYQSVCGNGATKAQYLSNLLLTCVAPTPVITKVETKASLPMSVIVYPNPTAKSFNLMVKTASSNQSATAKVYDIQGRVIKTLVVSTNTAVNFGNDLKPGVYFVEVKEGENTKTVRVVKY